MIRTLLAAACLAALAGQAEAQQVGGSTQAEQCAVAISGDVAGDVENACGMSREDFRWLLAELDRRGAVREAAAFWVRRIAIIGLAQRIAADRTVEALDQISRSRSSSCAATSSLPRTPTSAVLRCMSSVIH